MRVFVDRVLAQRAQYIDAYCRTVRDDFHPFYWDQLDSLDVAANADIVFFEYVHERAAGTVRFIRDLNPGVVVFVAQPRIVPPLSALRGCRRSASTEEALNVAHAGLLDAGADDFFPVSRVSEAVVRAWYLAERRELQRADFRDRVLDIPGFKINHALMQASYNGKKVELTSSEFIALSHLLRRHRYGASREDIVEEINNHGRKMSAASATVLLSHLRTKIAGRSVPVDIKAHYGAGYVVRTPKVPEVPGPSAKPAMSEIGSVL